VDVLHEVRWFRPRVMPASTARRYDEATRQRVSSQKGTKSAVTLFQTSFHGALCCVPYLAKTRDLQGKGD
jgi:hypothetical protein